MTGSKALLMDKAGKVVAVASSPHKLSVQKPLWHNISDLRSRLDVTSSTTPLCGDLDGSGTKLIYAVGMVPDGIRAEIRFPTTLSEETIRRAIDFVKQKEAEL
ncbi:MAG: hypothetical protein ABIF04_07980 [Chloroflexota bacterium]